MAEHTQKVTLESVEIILQALFSFGPDCVLRLYRRPSDLLIFCALSPLIFRYFSQKRVWRTLIINLSAKDGVPIWKFKPTLYERHDHLIFVRDVDPLTFAWSNIAQHDTLLPRFHELKTPLTVMKRLIRNIDMFKDSLPKACKKAIVNNV